MPTNNKPLSEEEIAELRRLIEAAIGEWDVIEGEPPSPILPLFDRLVAERDRASATADAYRKAFDAIVKAMDDAGFPVHPESLDDHNLIERVWEMFATHASVIDQRDSLLAENAQLKAEVERLVATKDGAYEERNRLVALLAAIYPSTQCRTKIEGWEPEWEHCVYIQLPTGQASWHYHESQSAMFAHVPHEHTVWDWHTTEEKYERVKAAIPETATQVERLKADGERYVWFREHVQIAKIVEDSGSDDFEWVICNDFHGWEFTGRYLDDAIDLARKAQEEPDEVNC